MKLELAYHHIKEIQLGKKTSISNGVLSVCKDELTTMLAEDPLLEGVGIEIARPGESVRIINMFDVIEPRIKDGGSGGVFPGLTGRVETVGQGRTHVLKGVGVVTTGIMDMAWEGLFDMGGSGASLSPHSSLNNIVIVPPGAAGADPVGYVDAIIAAGLKAAEYLARASLGLPADTTELFELAPLSDRAAAKAGLPKVAYLYHIYSHRDMRDTFYYGEKPRHLIPTLIHPNEVFDGAIVTGNYDMPSGMKNETIFIQNHPVIRELYRRHNKDLFFAGVVIANEHATMKEKEKSALLSAKLIKHVIGADAVLITQTGGGHPNIDLMLSCRMCEQQGVRTVVMVSEESSADGSEFSLTMMVPEADAVVSTGNINEEVELPPVHRVIGGNGFRRMKEPPGGALRVPYHMIPGATSQIGGTNLTAFPY
jgi:glycine reductase complex component B subunit alpha and beta